MPNVTNKQILERIESQVKDVKIILIGDGTVESMEKSVQNRLIVVEKTVKDHIEQCNGNGARPKDDDGKYIEQRKTGWYKWRKRIPVIALGISILTFVGGWSACEYIEGKVHSWFIEYTDHLNESE